MLFFKNQKSKILAFGSEKKNRLSFTPRGAEERDAKIYFLKKNIFFAKKI